MFIKNMLSAKGREVPNQFIIENDNKVYFQSYKSLIAVYDKNLKTLEVFKDWNYSKTTLKYFKEFVNEYTQFYL